MNSLIYRNETNSFKLKANFTIENPVLCQTKNEWPIYIYKQTLHRQPNSTTKKCLSAQSKLSLSKSLCICSIVIIEMKYFVSKH